MPEARSRAPRPRGEAVAGWRFGWLAGALLVAGCAAYDGHSLIPGRSTAAEIEATMGRPAERQARDGETVWWYPRGPLGFDSFAVSVGSDGVLRSVEQRLTVENLQRVHADRSTQREVRELFGPPFEVSRLSRQGREVWEYQMRDIGMRWKLWIQFSADGIVREVLKMRHPDEDPPSDSGFR